MSDFNRLSIFTGLDEEIAAMQQPRGALEGIDQEIADLRNGDVFAEPSVLVGLDEAIARLRQ